MKGVSPNFFAQNKIDSAVIEGNYQLQRAGNNYALIGRGVQYQLSIRATNAIVPMYLLYPKAKASISLDPENTFREKPIMVGGVFVIERQYDDSYIFVPLDFARDLLAYGTKRTSLEIRVESRRQMNTVERRLEQVLGPKFDIKNSDEQHLSLLRAVKIEKMFVFITFAFILLIASLNIFFSLSMLVIDKKKDIAILASMGASPKIIRNIFLMEGAIVAFVGAFIGLAAGLLICWTQQTFGLISMNMATALVEAYPVKMQLQDFLLTGSAIFIITLLVSIRPARAAAATEVRDNI